MRNDPEVERINHQDVLSIEISTTPTLACLWQGGSPATPTEALMAVGDVESRLEQEAANGPLHAAVCSLDERELFVLDACLFERMSLRRLGERMGIGKTHVARIRDRALGRVRQAVA